ncbi:IucA/IucC family protein [Streptomyces albipurpureus]|uniref:IucA/IucC family siderophore biosynthesis protein n=1 Tax=Streptomyces albipurpureus TaxID=2897419 RepID=A0ABT0UQE2_9ACTN|nr:IucA/IucC family siderophore biosynthesis protein [Streptomyces sp. CWNU-1]MCM2389845.1 IucA/IucC family siderophore biosynthesis protein [Streptomyces sp. CWNU-1]
MTASSTDTDSGLLLRVLSTLLREDVAGLRTRSTTVTAADGIWLRLATTERNAVLLPVHHTTPGFQSRTEARLPLLRCEHDGRELTGADDILAALAVLADPRDRTGFDAFAAEIRQAATAQRLHAASKAAIAATLAGHYGAHPARDWRGLPASLAYDTLAARLDHPVYPTGRGRSGLTESELRAYAPEFHPRFPLRWLALPQENVITQGALPDLFPHPSALGLPAALDHSHRCLPLHPRTVGEPLERALHTMGLTDRAVLAARAELDAVPTLSMRTVALTGDPRTHLKLPLATATLGRLNRRTIKPGTLTDGVAGQRLLERVIAREPRFRHSILHADESRFAHAGHELIAVLVRRLPAGLDDTAVVPLAALLAPAPGGGLIIGALAEHFYRGDTLALLDAFLTLLFDWQTTLLGYGIALESHQQNISLLLDAPHGKTRLRLLFKDNDGPRIHTARLRATLGEEGNGFDDPRIHTHSDTPILDLFTTITVHLCAGAYAFGLARHGYAPLERLLTLIRDRLDEAADRLGTRPGQPGALLRSHVLDAAHLPIKAMVTAGTLLAKERSGASDINKHYGTGPNYLAPRKVRP